MVSMTGCNVMLSAYARFRQLLVPDRRKFEGLTATREMRPGDHTRRHDWDVTALCHNQLGHLKHTFDVHIVNGYRKHMR
jgi:hypothetical protein